MASKDEIRSKMDELLQGIEATASSLPESAWSTVIYENGWTARELLAHMASTSGTAGFLLAMAGAPSGEGAPGAGLGANFDVDGFNAQQVTLRKDKSTAEILAEIRSTFDREKGVIGAAAEDLLGKQYTAPWGIQGALSDVIMESLDGHLGMHLVDLRSAAG
jgi:hypothetical protein